MTTREIKVDSDQHITQMGFWDELATWIGANANNGTWYMGGVLAALGLAGALGVILISGPLAYVFLAAVGYIGYRVGASTMNLMRPAFGVRGSIGPSLINVVQFMGWAAVNTYIAAISVSYLLSDLFGTNYFKPGGLNGMVIGVVIMGLLHLISISLGQRSIRLIERIGIILVIVLVLWETVIVLKSVPLSKIFAWQPPETAHLSFGTAIDIFAAFNLAWVTAAADFTRFAKHRSAATKAPFFGATMGLYWFSIVGSLTTIAAAISTNTFSTDSSDPSTVASKLGLGVLALLVIMITSTTANAVNLMAAGSALNNIVPRVKLTPALWIVTIIATLMSFIPFVVGGFLATFTWFLDLVGMILGPEIAILLVDYFLIHQQKYQLSSFNQVKGPYWYTRGFNVKAYLTWGLSVGIYFGLQQLTVIKETIGATWLTMGIAAIIYSSLVRFSMHFKMRKK
ncbi:cytosine permease [Weissella diestrammenae]|uniref:Cytosine permease n=1 Tax=Weissella diestrammenae TaxID=1162633 RepID=A0A7G9T5Y2_9LACO|nr:cytosine permease [Weissella diestrammenae]MCM0582339.1 cytosine permease [Weissella diestrammenae]QNN75507.1 cytosine permease [Weissella diestrammenae]